MTLNPVESSMISRIGYSPELNLLRAVMSDGSVYDCPAVSEREYVALMASPSKGNFWHQHFKARATANGDPMPDAAAPHIIELREPQPPGMLETFAEDDCCSERLQKATRRGSAWECPRCGCEWEAEVVGDVKHWKPRVSVFNLAVGRRF